VVFEKRKEIEKERKPEQTSPAGSRTRSRPDPLPPSPQRRPSPLPPWPSSFRPQPSRVTRAPLLPFWPSEPLPAAQCALTVRAPPPADRTGPPVSTPFLLPSFLPPSVRPQRPRQHHGRDLRLFLAITHLRDPRLLPLNAPVLYPAPHPAPAAPPQP
jgi:hypothetical protein